MSTTLETTQGQVDGSFSQLPFKFHLPEVASVGDCLEICPWVASRVAYWSNLAQAGRGYAQFRQPRHFGQRGGARKLSGPGMGDASPGDSDEVCRTPFSRTKLYLSIYLFFIYLSIYLSLYRSSTDLSSYLSFNLSIFI